jgi:hypothetical protein
VLDEAAEFTPRPLSAHFADVPLWTHCRYSTEELLAATGQATLERVPSSDMAGVRYVQDLRTDVLTFTLQKSEREYSPTTLYRDYAISLELIHWESQSTTSLASPTGQRYLNQRRDGSHVLLFARETKNAETGSAGAYLCLGEADYVSHRLNAPSPSPGTSGPRCQARSTRERPSRSGEGEAPCCSRVEAVHRHDARPTCARFASGDGCRRTSPRPPDRLPRMQDDQHFRAGHFVSEGRRGR